MSYASVFFNSLSLYRLWTMHACSSHHMTVDFTADGRGSLTWCPIRESNSGFQKYKSALPGLRFGVACTLDCTTIKTAVEVLNGTEYHAHLKHATGTKFCETGVRVPMYGRYSITAVYIRGRTAHQKRSTCM